MGKRSISQKALREVPQISKDQCIAKVVETKGGGLFQVESALDHLDLVSLPSKFQKLLWVRRGTYVIVQPDMNSKTKINGEIVHVLLPADIKDLKSLGIWPDIFNDPGCKEDTQTDSELDDLFVNTNRCGGDDDSSDD